MAARGSQGGGDRGGGRGRGGEDRGGFNRGRGGEDRGGFNRGRGGEYRGGFNRGRGGEDRAGFDRGRGGEDRGGFNRGRGGEDRGGFNRGRGGEDRGGFNRGRGGEDRGGFNRGRGGEDRGGFNRGRGGEDHGGFNRGGGGEDRGGRGAENRGGGWGGQGSRSCFQAPPAQDEISASSHDQEQLFPILGANTPVPRSEMFPQLGESTTMASLSPSVAEIPVVTGSETGEEGAVGKKKKKKKGGQAKSEGVEGEETCAQSAEAAKPTQLTSPSPSAQSDSPSLGSATAPSHQKKKKGGKKALEGDMASLSISSGPPAPVKGMLPNRPDKGGVLGVKIMVGVNCWDFSISDGLVLMYDIEAQGVFRMAEGKRVDIRPTPKGLREYLQEIIIRLPETAFYDGGRIIYSLKPLPGVPATGITKEESIKDPMGRDDLIIKYIIKKVSEVSASTIRDYVANPRASTVDIPQEAVNMVDCLIKWINKKVFVNIGRAASFNPLPMKTVPNKLFVIHRGYMASVRPQWKVRLNIDMVHRAFFPTGNLADILYEKFGNGMGDGRCWREMENDIIGVRVEASHYKNDETGVPYKRRFTIHGLSSNPSDKEMLPDKNISISAYFKERYNIILKFPELPCIKVKKEKKEYMPMELVYVIPYQTAKADKGDIASEIIRCAAVRPAERFKELDTFVHGFVKMQHTLAKQMALTIDVRQPVQVEARILPQPNGQFAGGPPAPLGRGKWNPMKYYKSVGQNTKWALVAVPPGRFTEDQKRKLAMELPQAAFRCGVSLDKTPIQKTITTAQLKMTFDECYKQKVELIVFILSDTFAYSEIKRLGDLHIGMKTQCVKSQTLNKPNVLPNLLLKINGKLGGTNWVVNSLVRDNNLVMVMGADVTHPAPAKDNQLRKSVAAVIGSVTPDLMQYAAVIRQQATTDYADKATREVIDSMDEIVTDLLKTFGQRNNDRLPQRIIFYRDGVSEGQFLTVLREELTAIQRACAMLRPGYEPGITFIVVQKRHHIRLKPLDPRARNVDPGTVVDRDVVHPREFDFFLCSQEGIQGTSKPAHYHVLYDDNSWGSDTLQMFTYYLCHAYMRCCRSVSYPAPTFYSHLAAFRARDWLKMCNNPLNLLENNKFRVNESQKNFMFFL